MQSELEATASRSTLVIRNRDTSPTRAGDHEILLSRFA